MTGTATRKVKTPSETSDHALFARIAEGDLAPLGELFDRHHASVRQFLLRIAPSSADVDDLVQETFLTAARAAGSFHEGAAARPFLFGVAAQLQRRKRRSFARLRAMLEGFGKVRAEPEPTAFDAIASDQRHAALHAAMAKLSEPHRVVLAMVELGEMSGVEAARALDLPPGTVWRHLSEARAELARHLGKRTS